MSGICEYYERKLKVIINQKPDPGIMCKIQIGKELIVQEKSAKLLGMTFEGNLFAPANIKLCVTLSSAKMAINTLVLTLPI